MEEFCLKSNEELLYKIEKYNKSIKDKENPKKKVIASLDVVKLYNNIDIDEAAAIVGKEVEESKVNFQGLDSDKLAK